MNDYICFDGSIGVTPRMSGSSGHSLSSIFLVLPPSELSPSAADLQIMASVFLDRPLGKTPRLLLEWRFQGFLNRFLDSAFTSDSSGGVGASEPEEDTQMIANRAGMEDHPDAK